MTRAKAALPELGRDTLVLGDRLYGTVDFFATLRGQGCWGLVRRNRLVSLHKLPAPPLAGVAPVSWTV
jgi:hypothetical protein